ncbi:MAG: AAA family ATPase [Bacteroidetes bacterium]|nr:AAA family ATPase [Bacteroidota bacterium]
MEQVKLAAMAMDGIMPEPLYLAKAMLLHMQGRKVMAEVLQTEEDKLYHPEPVGQEKMDALKTADFLWPFEIVQLFNPELSIVDELNIDDQDPEMKVIILWRRMLKTKKFKLPKDLAGLANALKEVVPHPAWFVRADDESHQLIVQAESVASKLAQRWPHLADFYRNLIQLFKTQLRMRGSRHVEPVFYFSGRRDAAMLDQLSLGLTGKKPVVFEEGHDKFGLMRQILAKTPANSLVIIRLNRLRNEEECAALINSLGGDLGEDLPNEKLFYTHLDGEVHNLFEDKYLLIQVLLPDELAGNFNLHFNDFKALLLENLKENNDDEFFPIISDEELFEKLLSLSTPSNSITQASINLQEFFRLCMQEFLRSYAELTGDAAFGRISHKDVIHLAARFLLSQRLTHVMPETYVLYFRKFLRELLHETDNLSKPFKVGFPSGWFAEAYEMPDIESLMSYYASMFADYVKEQRTVAFFVEYQVEQGVIFIKEESVPGRDQLGPVNRMESTHTLGDVAGMDEVKKELAMLLDGIRHPEKYEALGVHPLHNVLLYGPPGSGKTFVVKAFANEAGIPFFYKSAAEINGQPFAGFGANMLREFLRKASHNAPCIVFLDELDAFSNRNFNKLGDVAYDAKTILDTLLTWMDGLDSNRDIIFVGATNRLEDVDEALIRHGRFGFVYEVNHLTDAQRMDYLRMLLLPDQVEGDYENMLSLINESLPTGHPNSSVKALVEEIKRKTIANNRQKVLLNDVEEALDTHLMGFALPETDAEVRRALAYRISAEALAKSLLIRGYSIRRIVLSKREKAFARIINSSVEDNNIFVLARDIFAKMISTYCTILSEQKALNKNLLPIRMEMDTIAMLAGMLVENYDIGQGEQLVLTYALGNNAGFSDSSRVRRKTNVLVGLARDAANNLLHEYWPEIQILAGALMRSNSVGQEVLAFMPKNKLSIGQLLPDHQLAFC